MENCSVLKCFVGYDAILNSMLKEEEEKLEVFNKEKSNLNGFLKENFNNSIEEFIEAINLVDSVNTKHDITALMSYLKSSGDNNLTQVRSYFIMFILYSLVKRLIFIIR